MNTSLGNVVDLLFIKPCKLLSLRHHFFIKRTLKGKPLRMCKSHTKIDNSPIDVRSVFVLGY